MLTIRGDQLRPGVIEDIHIKGKLSESVLNINWSLHGGDILSSKKVLDYIQVDNLTFSAAALDVTAQITAPSVTSGSADEGVLSDAPHNKVIVRSHATGEPVLDADGKQVFGRLTFDDVTSKWTLTLKTTDTVGTEVDFTPSEALAVDIQYLRRFNLNTVSELFAANEKWVDGAADVTAHLNIEQLAKDLYGTSFSLDRDGQANRDISVGDELAQARNSATYGSKTSLKDRLDAAEADLSDVKSTANTTKTEVEQARNSTLYGNKASLKERLDAAETEISAARGGKADVNTRISDVESNVSTLNTDLSNLSADHSTLKSEVETARSSTLYGNKTALKDRLDAAESEISAARGGKADLNTRITDLETSVNTRTSNLETAAHTHHRAVINPTDGQTQVNMPAGHTYVAGSDTLEVYLNGLLLIAGEDYTEDAGGTFVTMNVALQAADRVILKWTEAVA